MKAELKRTQSCNDNEEHQIESDIAKALPDSTESHSCRRLKRRGDGGCDEDAVAAMRRDRARLRIACQERWRSWEMDPFVNQSSSTPSIACDALCIQDG
jgi:hypothetical protein